MRGVPVYLLAAALLFAPIALADVVGMPALGFHPSEDAYATVYTGSPGDATLEDGTDVPMVQATTDEGDPVGCQGNVDCRMADIPDLPEGQYALQYGNSSYPFTVSSDVYADTLPTYLEWFNAHMMQDSAYHGTYFGTHDPVFTMMADGAFVITSSMASDALTRLSQAYNVNPSMLQTDTYDVLMTGEPDSREYIRAHVDLLRSFQASNGQDNPYDMPEGFTDPWGEWLDQDPALDWHTESSPSYIEFSTATSPIFTAKASYAYMTALPAMHEQDPAYAEELFFHTLATMEHVDSGSLPDEAAAYLGAAYFRAYDHTGNATYIDRAYELRDQVGTVLISDVSAGPEFYWEEYLKHRQQIQDRGHDIMINGQDPLEIYRGKIYFDYSDRGSLSMDRKAERVYEFDREIEFSNSRFIILEGIFAAKARQFDNDPLYSDVASSQLAWLTGRNAVQYEDVGGDLTSLSFVSGIGRTFTEIHSRITPPVVRSGEATFANGKTHIPGWISGPYDSNGDTDIIMNFREDDYPFRFTESTNEMVGMALQLSAMQDAYLNDRDPVDLVLIDPVPGDGDDGENGDNGDNGDTGGDDPVCSESLESAEATCTGGTITSDTFNGCRTVICESDAGSLEVLACPKDGFFEMYNQGRTDDALEVCLDGTCISNNGFAQSPDFCPDDGDDGTAGEGTLSIDIVITNDDGGTLAASDVSLSIDGMEAQEGTNELEEGTYTLSTSTHQGYDRTILGDCTSSGSVTIQAGQESSCTVAFDDVDDTSGDPGVCADSLADLPVSCTGTITSDTFNGCRTIVCEEGGSSLQVLACPKPNGEEPEFFEMYRQEMTGDTLEVCLADTCISNRGFEQSDDMCGAVPDDGDDGADDGTGDDGDDGTQTGVDLHIKDWYPQGRNYVFVCDADAASYDWMFGDGHSQTTNTDNVYHTYADAGDYTVTCEAAGGQDTLDITVT